MRTQSLLLASLLLGLYGCQPETPAQPASEQAGEHAATPASAPTEAAGSGVTVADSAPVAEAVTVAVVKPEADALALAKKNNCLACHAIDRKIVGPAWKDVAAKYRGDAGAEANLVNKIAKGGSGVWGSVAMPAHPQISEADRITLARFVLNLK